MAVRSDFVATISTPDESDTPIIINDIDDAQLEQLEAEFLLNCFGYEWLMSTPKLEQ
jgi:CHASE2 domain-containing sensor protein